MVGRRTLKSLWNRLDKGYLLMTTFLGFWIRFLYTWPKTMCTEFWWAALDCVHSGGCTDSYLTVHLIDVKCVQVHWILVAFSGLHWIVYIVVVALTAPPGRWLFAPLREPRLLSLLRGQPSPPSSWKCGTRWFSLASYIFVSPPLSWKYETRQVDSCESSLF